MTQHFLNGFYPNYYRWKYFDEMKGKTRTELIEHFINNGKREGRSGSPFFEVGPYMTYNPGLTQKFESSGIGERSVWAYEHWENEGASAGLLGSPLFHARYYLDSYPDLEHNGVNCLTSTNHWINSGIPEGRSKYSKFDGPQEQELKAMLTNNSENILSLTGRQAIGLDSSPDDSSGASQEQTATTIIQVIVLIKDVVEAAKESGVWEKIFG